MITMDTCPICKGTDFEDHLYTKDHFLSQENFTIARCKRCSFRLTNPRPEDSDIGRYYKSNEYISHSNSGSGLVARLYKIVRSYTLSQKEGMILRYVSRGTILDYGCGTGHFLTHCKKSSWQVIGIEPDAGARQIARQAGLDVFSSESDLKAGYNGAKPDAISLWHVLEHLPDLNDRITFIKSQLKDKGLLVIAVPNPDSHDAKHYGEYWAAYDLPRHLYHFCKKDVTSLLINHGFDLIDTKPMIFDSFYVSLLSEKYKHGKPRMLKAFYRGFISNLKAISSGEYSSRIYLFRKA